MHTSAVSPRNETLTALIVAEIEANGPIRFSRFMQRALYEPDAGYYMNDLPKFGAQGDFVTAPEISPLFAQCVAAQCAQLINDLDAASVLEIGAGNGTMAADILLQLDQLQSLPEHYYIFEISAGLRKRQQQRIAALPESLRARVQWLDTFDNISIHGVVLANEVADALPFERFVIRNGAVMSLLVDWRAEWQKFVYQECAADDAVEQAVRAIESSIGTRLPDNYLSEINLQIPAWLNSISGVLQQGMLLMMDYGYPRGEYYHAQRTAGSLMCHYRHRAHDDALSYVGLQDITAQVDFTAVAEAGSAAGFEVAGYALQAGFLLDCGIERLLQDAAGRSSFEQLRYAQQAKTLLLPGEMGERFKVLALSKQYNRAPRGFSGMHDKRHFL